VPGVVVATLLSLALVWGLLVAALFLLRPDGTTLRDGLRLLPDSVRLLQRLARDKSLGGRLRLRLWLLLGYLALPIDLVPDFLPVIGFADDAILILWVLRSVVRSAGREALVRHWPGTDAGLATLERLAGLSAA
jgi:uncharacterized membrane protein YkvA (DUF1232 family)